MNSHHLIKKFHRCLAQTDSKAGAREEILIRAYTPALFEALRRLLISKVMPLENSDLPNIPEACIMEACLWPSGVDVLYLL